MSSVSNPAVPKAKTKAKKRYLKAKKQRRQQKKAFKQPSNEGELPTVDNVEGSSEDGMDTDEGDNRPQSVTEENPSRPRKRRKIEEPGSAEEQSPLDEEVELHSQPVSPRRGKSPTPPEGLPSFPLPKRPDAPSRDTLALQGLDKALIEAKIVDPEWVVQLSDSSVDREIGIGERTKKRLKELGLSELFAVQTAVIPFLLGNPKQRTLYLPYDPPGDICVSAPTGSGKTLAYVVPIVEILSSRAVTRLRALVVLPTRDLVIQVRETFEAVAKGRGLKVGSATGQHSFSHEQAQLVGETSARLQGGSSKVDVLICTPGRLMDHLKDTPNFSLQHLRFLVVDEADRLLAQSFQDWLSQVLAAIQPSPLVRPDYTPFPSPLPLADAVSPCWSSYGIHTSLDEKRESSCQKLLFSATLTRDPSKIAALNLRNPKYLVVQKPSRQNSTEAIGVLDLVMEKFTTPATLTEHMIVCEPTRKPLMLFHLVHNIGVLNALVFTKSAESTSRLVRLFEFFEDIWASADPTNPRQKLVIKAYSSDLGAGDRKQILDAFKNQEIHLLVCSDLISRGIDISHVSHVVSYDAPVDIRKYVHRVGRTARAGRAGDAWTLVEEQEARYFKTLLKSADHLDTVKRMRVSDKALEPLLPFYERALRKLGDHYSR